MRNIYILLKGYRWIDATFIGGIIEGRDLEFDLQFSDDEELDKCIKFYQHEILMELDFDLKGYIINSASVQASDTYSYFSAINEMLYNSFKRRFPYDESVYHFISQLSDLVYSPKDKSNTAKLIEAFTDDNNKENESLSDFANMISSM